MTDETWDEALGAWRAWLRSAGRPPTTIRLRTQHLAQWRRACPGSPWDATTDALVEWTGGQDWQRSTRASVRSSLRVFYEWAHQTGRCVDNPAVGLPAVPARPPNPHPLPDRIWLDLLERAPARERLMIRLAASCGLRRGEIARVHARDVHEDMLGWSLTVHGKGDRERVVPLPDDIAAELRAARGYVFPGQDDGHLSPQWVGDLVSALLPEGWSLHSLRHRFATRAYGSSRDLLAVQQILGHTTPTTTQLYVRMRDDALRAAMLSAA